MSIIAEALKKAKKSSLLKLSEPKTDKPRARKHQSLIYVSLSAILLLIFPCIILYYFLSRNPIRDDIEIPIYEPQIQPRLEKENGISFSPATSSLLSTDEYSGVEEAIKLSGIMYTPEKPLAVINNSIRTEGESIGEFKLLEIGKDFVKLTREDEEFIIRLKK